LAVEPQFQIPDMLADSWLAGVKKFGSLGEAFMLVDCDEYFQMSRFDGLVLSW